MNFEDCREASFFEMDEWANHVPEKRPFMFWRRLFGFWYTDEKEMLTYNYKRRKL